MTQREIKALLEERYDREQWKKLITTIFPGRDVFARPVEHEATTVAGKKQVQHIYQFGDVQLTDGNVVGLFEVSVAKGVDLTSNRVAIRKAIEQPVKQSGNSGALIAFVDAEHGIWRFSFYSNTLKEDGTWDPNNPKRYTYLLGEGEKCRTAAEQFETLAKKTEPVTLKDLLGAFSVEKVSDAFFREYKEHYQDFVQHLTGKRMVKKANKWEEKVMHPPSPKLTYVFNGNEKDARDFCKKLMGRLVFLYFLQKKGWLGASSTTYADGDVDFVGNLFRTRGDKDFYQHVLKELFFDTLNSDRPGEEYTLPNGHIVHVPFLNGGLFDRDALDNRSINHQLILPSELFSNPAKVDEEKERGFLDFLNAYNFTVDESLPDDETLAVDPEMLGRIFENLLEDNKDKGAYYTPKPIVRYMCRESLAQYLKNYLLRNVKGTPPVDLEDQLRNFLKDGTGARLSSYSGLLLKALYEVKVCDPAIGSGAFPMGILHEIFQAVYHLQEFSPDEFEDIWGLKAMDQWEPAEVKLRIIQHSIYGVDIERGAVDIARLRFWLSIIVDERTPRTLPNLDYKIVVGDSLLGKFNKEVLHIDWELKGSSAKELEIQETVKELGKKSALFFRDQPIPKKEKLAKDIRALKIDLLTQQLEFNREKYAAESARTKAMFEPSKKDQVHALEVQGRLANFERALRELKTLSKQKEEQLDCFDWQLDFPEVLNKHVVADPGFDIVIGNPPYVRHEKITASKDDLLGRYESTFTKTADLSVCFVQLGHQILREAGVFAYIVSNKWMRATYGSKLKDYLGKQTLLQLLDFGEQPVFEATAYTCVLISQREQASATHETLTWEFSDLPLDNLEGYVQQAAHRQPQSALVRSGYLISKADTEALVSYLRGLGRPFGEVFPKSIYRGVTTGYNGAFVISRERRDELVSQDPKSREIIKPFLGGKQLSRYDKSETNNYIIFTRRGVDLTKYPAIKRHLEGYREGLEPRPENYVGDPKDWPGRKPGNYAWYEIQDSTDYYAEFEKPKIIISEIALIGQCSLDEHGHYVDATINILTSDSKFLLGYLNSRLFAYLFSKTSSSIQGGYYRWKRQYIEKMPYVAPGPGTKDWIGILVNKRLQLSDGPEATALEREIDVLVCKLYGLSWEQAKVVDPELGLSQAEYDAIELPEREAGNSSMVSEPGVTGLTDEGTLFGQPVEEAPTRRGAGRVPKSGSKSKK